MGGNMYERFCSGELPEELQKKAAAFAGNGKSYDEGLFRAGFFLGMRFEEYRKELMGGDDE